MASVPSLASSVNQRVADALAAAMPKAGSDSADPSPRPSGWGDPMLRRSDRADFQANGILALAKKAKANPRELATTVVEGIPTGDLIQEIEVSGPGFLNITITDRAIIETLAARAATTGSASRSRRTRAPR